LKTPVSSNSDSNSSLGPAPAGLAEIPVGELPRGVLVEVLHVGVGGSRVDVEVVLLDVLAVIRLAVRESEQAFLQDRIALVPEREREAEPLAIVRDAVKAGLATVPMAVAASSAFPGFFPPWS
jgi:hypothetical protein